MYGVPGTPLCMVSPELPPELPELPGTPRNSGNRTLAPWLSCRSVLAEELYHLIHQLCDRQGRVQDKISRAFDGCGHHLRLC